MYQLYECFLFYLFTSVLDLHCCVGLSPFGASGGPSLTVVRRLLSLRSADSRACRLQRSWFPGSKAEASSCGTWA